LTPIETSPKIFRKEVSRTEQKEKGSEKEEGKKKEMTRK
jgi:hypothetical protein